MLEILVLNKGPKHAYAGYVTYSFAGEIVVKLKAFLSAIALAAVIVAAPAFAADQKRILTTEELDRVNAGIFVLVDLGERFFIFSRDRVFGNFGPSVGSCGNCGFGITVVNNGSLLFQFPQVPK